jgi:hypothetical protein
LHSASWKSTKNVVPQSSLKQGKILRCRCCVCLQIYFCAKTFAATFLRNNSTSSFII